MSRPINPFKRADSFKPRFSAFNWSAEHKYTCDMGQLIPVFADYLPPGARIKGGVEAVVRFQPLVAPVLHEVNAYFHFFFVPLRLVDEHFTEFITGGKAGDFDSPPPLWPVTEENGEGSLFDFLVTQPDFDVTNIPENSMPVDWKRRAYNLIYNEWYRDENLIDPIPVLDSDTGDEFQSPNFNVLNRAWEKDYFTSALPFMQRGISPAFPISGTIPVDFSNALPVYVSSEDDGSIHGRGLRYVTAGAPTIGGRFISDNSVGDSSSVVQLTPGLTNTGIGAGSYYVKFDGPATVDLSEGVTFDVNDVRRAFQIQKFMERNARAGVRYTEFIQAHFGVHDPDARLQRPEYLGGTKTGVIISEVLQTSASSETSPQGTMAGHGITALRDRCINYFAPEFGIVMCLCSIMPRSGYQQGVDRKDLVRTRYDMLFPEFVNLSEQPVYNEEIYLTQSEDTNKGIFGFQGRYNEWRTRISRVSSGMRNTFDYWHLNRKFSALPVLGGEFITCTPSKRIFAVQNEPGLVIDFAFSGIAVLPLPRIPQPGLVDHDGY